MLNIQKHPEETNNTLPPATGPAGNYVDCVIVGNILKISGKGPLSPEGIVPTGKLGAEFTKEEGYQLARLVGMNMLSVLEKELGSPARIERVVEIQGMINAVPSFTEHHKVLDGLSDFLIERFGDSGRHVRSVFGANSLRDNLPIIATGTFIIRP
jgi:enamine deaminase RidA (YjgF/YER057c/UK114 family)